MAFLADLYRVTAGGDWLRSFFTKDGAAKYAAAVVVQSHPSVGLVRVEGRDGLTGRWHPVIVLDVPRGR